MKLPRLPRRPSRSQDAPRRKDRFVLWAALVFVIALVTGFLAYLPVDPLVSRLLVKVERQSHLQLEAGHTRLSFPCGIAMDRLKIISPQPNVPPLVLKQIDLQPLWSSLTGGNPGVQVDARLLGGELEGDIRSNGVGEATLKGVSIDDLPLSPQLSLKLSLADGSAHWQGQLPIGANHSNQLELTVGKLQLSGLAAAGAKRDQMVGGPLKLTASSQGSLARIEKLDLAGNELQVAGSGTLQLGTTPASSRLALHLTLRPQSGLDPNLRDLLGLLAKPERDGSINLRLYGSLAAPKLR